MSQEASNHLTCPLCRGEATPVFAEHSWPLRPDGRIFRYARCPACEAMFANPQPTADEIAWLYGHRYDYTWFKKRKGLKRIQASHRWQRLRAYFHDLHVVERPSRMLDIGGGHAWFLRAAKADGWQAEGLELLDDELAASAAAHGITLHRGSIVDHAVPPGSFDLVTAWHIVEHVPDVRAAVGSIAELLTPNGIGVIAVPNYQAAGMTREGLGWVWCQKPFIHPWHLSATTLKQLVPPSVEILLLTSRDVWDAQYAETMWPFRFAMGVIDIANRIPRKLAAICHWKAGMGFCDEMKFLAEEALRLSAYAGYLAARPLVRESYEAALRGSELLLIVRKRASEPE